MVAKEISGSSQLLKKKWIRSRVRGDTSVKNRVSTVMLRVLIILQNTRVATGN